MVILNMTLIPKVNGEYIIWSIVIYFIIWETWGEKISQMLSVDLLQKGDPLPAIGGMNMVNTELQILKVWEFNLVTL